MRLIAFASAGLIIGFTLMPFEKPSAFELNMSAKEVRQRLSEYHLSDLVVGDTGYIISYNVHVCRKNGSLYVPGFVSIGKDEMADYHWEVDVGPGKKLKVDLDGSEFMLKEEIVSKFTRLVPCTYYTAHREDATLYKITSINGYKDLRSFVEAFSN